MPQYKLKPGYNHYDYRDAKDEDGNPALDANNRPVRERYKLKAGDIITMSEERFINANLKDRFTLVSGGSSNPSSSSSAAPEEDENEPAIDWSFIKTKKQQEVLDLISSVEDKDIAAAIYEAEESGKNRDKVLEAARAKYQELGGSE